MGRGLIILALIAIFSFANVESLLKAIDAENGQFPYMALLTSRKSLPYCSGAILTNRHILTNGHMLQHHDPEEFLVYLGAWNLRDKDAVIRDIADIKMHPEYAQGRKVNDLAMVRLVDEIKFFYRFIQPIALPTTDFPNDRGEFLLVSGFGLDSVGSKEISVFVRHFSKTINFRYRTIT